MGEEGPAAAGRELREETGLDAPSAVSDRRGPYDLAEEPDDVRVRFPPGTERVEVGLFRAAAPAGWEPALEHEHVERRWCTSRRSCAVALAEPREAVLLAHRLRLEGEA